MCIAIWTLQHPSYALILATNRDEFLSRPTLPADFHSFGSVDIKDADVLSGRDMQAGGTWLGINRKSGRISALTNITEVYPNAESSRGSLVSSFLLPKTESSELQQEIDALKSINLNFAGFNLLVFDPSFSDSGVLSYNATLVTNQGGGKPITSRSISPAEAACGALSNGVDQHGGNEWPKVKDSIVGLQHILDTIAEADKITLVEELFQLLARTSATPPSSRKELRNTIHVDPIVVRSLFEWNSSISTGPPSANGAKDTSMDAYGTRLSTVVLIGRDGNVLFIERDIWTFDHDGFTPIRLGLSNQRLFEFKLSLSSHSRMGDAEPAF